MSDSDFWSDLAKKFRALDENGPGKLKVGWSRVAGIEVRGVVCFLISEDPDEWFRLGVNPNSRSEEARNDVLATRAGARLAGIDARRTEARSLRELWLNTLRTEGFGEELGHRLEPIRIDSGPGSEPKLIIHRKCGKIENLIVAEADRCSRLESCALEAEHRMKSPGVGAFEGQPPLEASLALEGSRTGMPNSKDGIEAKPPAEPLRRRVGRPADDDLNRHIARILQGFGPNWQGQLDQIGKALDQDDVDLIFSKKWHQKRCDDWTAAVVEDPGGVKKALQHRLDWVRDHPEAA